MGKLKISIVIPVYQEKQYLSACLDSLLDQDFEEDYNILLIETGSDDGSDQVCEEYQRRYPEKVFWYHYPVNRGISFARNLGIVHSSAEYITFVDGDDTVSKDYLSSLYEKTKEQDYVIVSGNYDVVYEDGKTKKAKSFHYHGSGDKVLVKFFSGKEKYFHYTCWARLYKRSFLLVNHLSFPMDVSIFEDAIFLAEAFASAPLVCTFKKPIYHYRKHASSTLGREKDLLLPALKAYERAKSQIAFRNPELARKLYSRISYRLRRRLKKEAKRTALALHKETRLLLADAQKQIDKILGE